MANNVLVGAISSGPKSGVVCHLGYPYWWYPWWYTMDAMWMLKYQCEIIEADVDIMLANDNAIGSTLWHFFDFKVDNC